MTIVRGHVANIPFEGRSGRGILISFCDNFLVENTFSFPYADHMYDLCYVIFMSRGQVTKRERERYERTKWKENLFDYNYIRI